MARTIAQIQQSIIDAKTADPNLSALTSTSNVAIWRLWTYIIAFCQWTLETFFDLHVSEVTGIIAAQKAHTLQWYATMAKAFQYGYSLTIDSDTYSVIDTTAQIVNYAAAIEYTNGLKGLRIKVATLSGSTLSPLSIPQLAAFTAYMQAIKDAGVRLTISSANADSLKLNLNIYYNAMVLDAAGARLDGTEATPVQDAIDKYLENLPFNGLYINFELLEALKAVDGVIIPELVSAQYYYAGNPGYTSITTEYTPDAGYIRVITRSTDLTLNFIPHGLV